MKTNNIVPTPFCNQSYNSFEKNSQNWTFLAVIEIWLLKMVLTRR